MHPMLNIAVRAARAAGNLIARNLGQQSQFSVEEKKKDDLVTDIDRECERTVIQILQKSYRDHAFLAEESGLSGNTESEYVWVIDPIDGTTNFTRRMNCSSVSVALVHNGQAEYGVVYNPFVGELFAAQRGCGATLNGAPIRASSRDAAHAIVACGSTIYDRSYTDRHFAILRHLYDRCLDYRRFASAALDCCMVACGRAEIFFECRLSPWDYAAGSLIAQEAGGVAVRLDGSILDPQRPGSVFITNAPCREMRQGRPE